MALPNASVIKTAIESLYAVAKEDPSSQNSRELIRKIWSLQRDLNVTYPIAADITINDSTDANVAAFIGGGEGDALSAGSVFRTAAATADLTDNALATAKGSAVAVNDVYAIDDAGTGVVFLALAGDRAFDYSGEAPSDYEA